MTFLYLKKYTLGTLQNSLHWLTFFPFAYLFIIALNSAFSTTYWFINGSWSQGIDLPEARQGHATIWLSNTEILICGGSDATNTKSARCWIYYDLPGPYFKEMAPMAQPKRVATLGMAIKGNGERWIEIALKLYRLLPEARDGGFPHFTLSRKRINLSLLSIKIDLNNLLYSNYHLVHFLWQFLTLNCTLGNLSQWLWPFS